MDVLLAQEAVEVHFLGRILAARLFTLGISLYIWNFSRYGVVALSIGVSGVAPRPPSSLS